MKTCLVTGASGFVGTELCPYLNQHGWRVIKLVRRATKNDDERVWHPEKGELDPLVFKEIDAVIHLAGENIAEGRWTAAKKQAIQASRVKGTRLLVERINGAPKPPKVLLSASAIGIYGDRADQLLDEDSPIGDGFLAAVAKEWEEEAAKAELAGVRVAKLRFGMILSPKGGALAKMLPVFKLGGGGVLGSGKQYVSWISMHDLLKAIYFILESEQARGAYNIVTPNPVTNQQFTEVLGKLLNRPTPIKMPAMGLKLMFGEMATEVLLASIRVQPKRLSEQAFQFSYPELTGALKALLDQ